MARFKPAGSRKPKAPESKRALVPCVIIILAGFVLLFLLLYAVMRSSG